MYHILCIIPARSGSKGLPNKNIKLFKGHPLFTWSITQAKQSKYVKHMRIVVSTDSKEYLGIAKKYGAEAPFLRPIEISGDLSTDYDFIKHTIDWYQDNSNYRPDIILQLRPTQPFISLNNLYKFLENNFINRLIFKINFIKILSLFL